MGRRNQSHRIYVLFLVVLALSAFHGVEARADYQPRVAIVMCQDQYQEDWFAAHSSSQALVGLAGLVGVPYDTLTLEELLAQPAPDYTNIWFSTCVFVAEEHITNLTDFLQSHVDDGRSVFLDGPLAAAYRLPTGEIAYRAMGTTFPFLGIQHAGWRETAGYQVHARAGEHPITVRAGYGGGGQLTQGLAFGTDALEPLYEGIPGNEVLLDLVSPGGGMSAPFLVAAEPGTDAKIIAIGSYGTYVGPGTAFRNGMPAGFFDNQLLPYLVEAMLWLVGPEDAPFAGLQLSHAPMTVIGRLDADWSQVPEATVATIEYLNELARRTGVTTVYGIVSSFADMVDWWGFRPGIDTLQHLDGSVGSHSHTHASTMSTQLDRAGWEAEVAGSLQAIRETLSDETFAPDAYAFINPGDTIQSRDYGLFFDDIELFMTHGFESSVPYSSGVMGFGLPAGVPPRPVINNTPAPDFQWLYRMDWLYTVAEAAELQARILDYYQNTVGRGVLYNQMWHDYAMSDSAPPVNFPMAETMLPLYEANLRHFESNRIYAPAVAELVGKMHVAHGVAITSEPAAGALVTTLDYAGVPAQHRAHVAGMGLRVNNSDAPIAEVRIDGHPHHAFTSDTVLLPAVAGTSQTVTVALGDPGGAGPSGRRLTYFSKPFASVARQAETLVVRPREAGLATRFCVAGPRATVVLHADAYERTATGELCGRLAFGADAEAAEATDVIMARPLDTGMHALYIRAAGRAITSAAFDAGTLALTVDRGGEGSIEFEAPASPAHVRLDGEAVVSVTQGDGAFSVAVPASESPVALEVVMSPQPEVCHDHDADGITTCDLDCDDDDANIGVACPDDRGTSGGCGCRAGGQGGSGGPIALAIVLLCARALRRRHTYGA